MKYFYFNDIIAKTKNKFLLVDMKWDGGYDETWMKGIILL